MSNRCNYCGKKLVQPFGDLSSNVVVVSDYPLFDDVRNGMAYSGKYGAALKDEMGKVGIQSSSCKMMTLWKHAEDEECNYDWHLTSTLTELRGAKLVMMLGSGCLTEFADCTADETSGTIVKSKFLGNAIIVAGPSIAAIGKTPIGELRLALELFAKQRRKLK